MPHRVAVEKVNSNGHPSLIAQIGQENFESEVLRSDQLVLVAFRAAWSRPCHIMESVLEQFATACAGTVKVVAVDADDNPELSLWFEVQSIPTLLFFAEGKLRGRIIGTASKEAILARLRLVLHGGDDATTTSPTC